MVRVFAGYASSPHRCLHRRKPPRRSLQVRCLHEPTLRGARDEGAGMILATAHTGGQQSRRGFAPGEAPRLGAPPGGDAPGSAVPGSRPCKRRRARRARQRPLGVRRRRPPGGAGPARSPAAAGRMAMQMDRVPPGMRPPCRALRRALRRARGLAPARRGERRAPLVPVFTRRLKLHELRRPRGSSPCPPAAAGPPPETSLTPPPPPFSGAVEDVRARKPDAVGSTSSSNKRSHAWPVFLVGLPALQGELEKYAEALRSGRAAPGRRRRAPGRARAAPLAPIGAALVRLQRGAPQGGR